MRIEGIRIRNYRALRDVRLTDLPALCAFVGANGSGKSTLFDVFSFLKGCLVDNVRAAVANRGGLAELRSRGQTGPIEIELKFRSEADRPLITYELHVHDGPAGQPVVAREVLKYRRGQRTGKPWHFLDFRLGQGTAITNEQDYETGAAEKREEQVLDSPDILAIKGLGQFQRFRAASDLRKLLEDWHVSELAIREARMGRDAGYAEQLSPQGENLAIVAQFLYEHHRDVFDAVLRKMSDRVPGIAHVEAAQTQDGRIVLRFQDGAFRDPFIARFVSDGTIKMFAYLLLLHDPKPHPLLAIEEPENQLYPRLMLELAEEFREYALRGGQVFVSTHSPDFVNGLRVEELFWLAKGADGFTQVHRAARDPLVRQLASSGEEPLGALWKQGLFTEADPR